MKRFLLSISLTCVSSLGCVKGADIVRDIATAAEFQQAMLDVTLNPGDNHVLTITANLDLNSIDEVAPISVDAGSVVINGGGNTITAGNGTTGIRPFFIHTGTVTINNLTVDQGTAQGGTGGGGGMGAGGAVFVDTAGNLTLENVNFTNSSATGGNASVAIRTGGGGLGGDGGAPAGGTNTGGGGGGLYGDGGGSIPGGSNANFYGAGGGGGALGDGGDAVVPAGGGGGGLPNDGDDASATGGGAGGAIGGGGGGNGSTAPTPAGEFGGGGGAGRFTDGGDGGTFGGGGGGAPGTSGGNGGDFGGGGGTNNGTAGNGGFGGGGGNGNQQGGNGGFGGGGGRTRDAPGIGGLGGYGGGDGLSGAGGGAGFGGAVFVREGGTLTIAGTSSISGGSVAGGNGVGSTGEDGQARGEGIFLQGGGVAFDLAAGQTATIADTIADSSVALAGKVSGDAGGILTKRGAGVLILSGDNLYTGGTALDAGTLRVESDTALGTGNLTAATSTLDVADMVDLGNDVILNGDLTVNQTVGTGTLSGDISGGSGITKTGAGTTILSGSNSFDGPVDVQVGTLQAGAVDSLSDGSDYHIAGGAVLDLNGNALSIGQLTGNGTVDTGGSTLTAGPGSVVAPGNSIGTLQVTGTYRQTSGSTYEVEIEPGGGSDRIVVNGTANITGGTIDVQSGGQTGFSAGQRFTILTASGGVVGTYDSIEDDLAFFDASLLYLPNDVLIELLRNTTNFTDVALTPNQRAVARNLGMFADVTQGDLSNVLDAIFQLDAAGARNAFGDLSGELHASLHTAQRQFSESYLRQGRNHLRSLTGYRFSGGSGGNFVQGQSDGFAVTQYAGMTFPGHGGKAPVATDAENWIGWVDGYGVAGDVEGDGNASSFEYQNGGTAFGFDRRYGDALTLSVFSGYGRGNVSIDRNGNNAEADNAQVSFGAVYAPGAFYLLGAAGYGYHDYDTERRLTFGPINRIAEGDYDTHEAHGYLEAGIAGDFGPWVITPKATAQYLYLDTEGFAESGAGAAGLTVAREETNSLRVGAGLRASRVYDLERGGKIIPELSAHYYHEALDNSRPVIGAFGGTGGTTFTSQGAALGREFVEAGIGFTILGEENLDFGFRYDIQVSEEHVAHQGSGGIQIRW